MPTEMKLFINKPTIGFSDVDDCEPAQAIVLKPAELEAGVKIALRAMKFTYVTSLAVRMSL